MNKGLKIKEFNVPMPWGHIAVKTWGDEEHSAVLVVHGRMDNAGAFDRLIPHLPNSFYYICIDLPGHGKSSHFPPFLPLYTINYILVYKLLFEFFKRKTYVILGHSYGGHIGLQFAQLYPNYVEKLVMLDTIHIFPVQVQDFKDYLVDKFDENLKIQEKLKTGKAPTYTYEEALKRLQSGREYTPLTTDAATALLERGIESTSDGRYKFTLDQRMKHYIDPLHDFRYAIECLEKHPVTCPVLIILGNRFKDQQIYMKPFIKAYKNLENFHVKHVDGTHDVHNNTPEVVAPYISKFLLNQRENNKAKEVYTMQQRNSRGKDGLVHIGSKYRKKTK